MTDQRTPEDKIHGWLLSGPDTASGDLVERTMRPIPRMRQRRSWRIALERFVAPIASPAIAFVGVIVVVAGVGLYAVLGGLGGVGATPSPSMTATPNFTLTVSEGPDGHVSAGQGTYVNDPATNLNLCTHAPDGSWRYLYGGGDPYVNIDLLVGDGAGTAGSSDKVAMELSAGTGYVRFDPTQMRGGDEPGRSTATIDVTTGPSTTTFDITAVTPDKNSADDVAKVSVELSLTCPN